MTQDLRSWLGFEPNRMKTVLQGDCEVSSQKDCVFTTVLGSCVAVCLFDRANGVGGMNHYLLPGGADADEQSLKYGVFALELLVNGLLKSGANREGLRAKIFGGGRLTPSLKHIGVENVQIARDFLKTEGIPIERQSVFGTQGRRVHFHPASGRARVLAVLDAENIQISSTPSLPAGSHLGSIEIFR